MNLNICWFAPIKIIFVTDKIIEYVIYCITKYNNMKIGYNMMKKYLSNKEGIFSCKVKQRKYLSIK